MRQHTRRTLNRPRRVITAGVIASVAVALSACSGGGTTSTGATSDAEPQAGGTLTVAMAATPAIIDPFATSLQADWIIARQVCEPLFDVSSTYEVGPVLADSISDDGEGTYTIALRSGVTFQNDEPFTADDVVASLERYELTPGNGSILAGMATSITAVDDLTVQIELNTPSSLLPTLLTTAYMMPASLVKDKPITEPIEDLVCTGPYKLTSYAADGDIVLDRWDGYQSRSEASDGALGQKMAYADEIVFTPIPDASTRLQATESGQVDIGGAVSYDEYDSITSSGTAQAVLTSASLAPTVIFNKAEGVMSDVKMREAFMAALNMDDIMLAAFGNPDFYTVDGSIIPAVNSVWSTDAGTESFNQQDLDKVKTLLDEAGYDGEPIVWLTTKDDSTWYGPSVPAQQELKEAGINIDLQVMDQASIISLRTDPSKFDIFSSAIPTYADPMLLPYLQETFPGTWVSDERDALLTTLSTESDPDARKAAWEDMQTLIYQDLPFLKFGTTKVLAVVSNRTHIDNPDDIATNLYNIWVDQS
ncbi:MAG: ABC transporter substrate-binding protein [Microbacterium sp.]